MSKRDGILIGAFLLVPWVAISGGNIHWGHRNALLLSGLAITGGFIRNVWLKSFVFYFALWIAFLMWGGVAGFVGQEFIDRASTASLYIGAALWLYIAAQESRLPMERWYGWICGAALAQGVLAWLQMVGLDPYFQVLSLVYNAKKNLEPLTPTGSLGNNNFLGVYLAIAMPFFYRKWWCLAVPVLVFIILKTLTATAVVALAAGTAVYFKEEIRRRIWPALVVIPIALYLFITKASYTIRFTLDHDRFIWWAEAVRKTMQTLPGAILGLGPNADWGRGFPMHNEWVELFYDFGAVGLLLALGCLVTAYKGDRRLWAALVIAAVSCLGTYPMHLAPSVVFIMLLLGLTENSKIQKFKDSRAEGDGG